MGWRSEFEAQYEQSTLQTVKVAVLCAGADAAEDTMERCRELCETLAYHDAEYRLNPSGFTATYWMWSEGPGPALSTVQAAVEELGQDPRVSSVQVEFLPA